MKKLLALAVAATAASAQPALAYEAGDIFIRAGSITVDPDSRSSSLKLNGNILQRTEVTVDDNTQFGISFNYMLHQYVGLELLAATPFKHDLNFTNRGNERNGLPNGTIDLGETKHLPPTLFANFYPMGACSNIQPYIGVGLNYTNFFDEDTSSEFNAYLGDVLNTDVDTDIDLDDSWGVAYQAGLDWEFMDHWLVNASVAWMDIDTEADIDIEGAQTPLKITGSDIQVDPWVYRVNIGYRF
jgi:outer membrane protein